LSYYAYFSFWVISKLIYWWCYFTWFCRIYS